MHRIAVVTIVATACAWSVHDALETVGTSPLHIVRVEPKKAR